MLETLRSIAASRRAVRSFVLPSAPAQALVVALALVMALAPVSPAQGTRVGGGADDDAKAQANALPHVPLEGLERLLTDRRWSEPGHGVSLRVPRDARVQTVLAGGDLVRFSLPDQIELTVSFLGVSPEASLTRVKAEALAELMFLNASSTQVLDPVEPRRRAGRPSDELFGLVDDGENDAWMFGEVHIRIRPTITLVIAMRCPSRAFDEARTLLEAVSQSVDVADPAIRYAAQKAMLDAGEQWWLSRDPQRVMGLLGRTQWFRVYHDPSQLDIGFRRVRFVEAEEDGRSGLGAVLVSRQAVGPELLATELKAFVSSDGQFELWQANSDRRRSGRAATGPQAPGRGNAGPRQQWVGQVTQSVSETGVRDEDELSVSVTENVTEQFGWTVPEHGYLAQAELMMLPYVLPTEPIDMAFYVYTQDARSLAMATVSVRPTGEAAAPGRRAASWVAKLRLNPHQSEMAIYYDNDGALVGMDLGGGTRLIPSSRDEIARAWLDQPADD